MYCRVRKRLINIFNNSYAYCLFYLKKMKEMLHYHIYLSNISTVIKIKLSIKLCKKKMCILKNISLLKISIFSQECANFLL